MDLQSALAHATQTHESNVVGLQIHGRKIEVFRPRFCQQDGQCKVEHSEAILFQHGYEQGVLERDQLMGDAMELDYFVAPLSDDELDSAFDQQGENLLHRLLDGAPDPQRCINARDKAMFTSWCISTLAERNG
ncbi:MAG: hypothetical protein V7707_14230 [Motiliproteus sp.]